MNQSKLYLLREVLVTQVNNLIFYPVALTLVTLVSGFIPPIRTSMILWILCGTLLTLLYPIRCRIKKFLPFIASHLAIIGIIDLLCNSYRLIPIPCFQTLANAVNRYGMLFLMIAFSVYSISLRLHEKTSSEIIPIPFAVGLSAGALFFQHFQGNQEWDSYYKIALILVLALFFLHYYLSQYLDFLIVNASSAGVVPEKQIFHSGMGLTLLFTLFSTLILFFTSQYTWLKSILDVLRQIISVIMHFIFRIFYFTEASEEGELQIAKQEAGNREMMLPKEDAGSPIWAILETIILIVIVLAILFGLFKLLQNAIAFIKNAMRQRIRAHEETIVGVLDVREKCDTLNTQKHKRQLSDYFYFATPGERIRRIYKKIVTSYKTDRPMFYTAKEMERKMQAQPFSEIYEKARYSNETCTPQDIKRMKELCR